MIWSMSVEYTRTEDVCRALHIGVTAKDTASIRAKLKRPVAATSSSKTIHNSEQTSRIDQVQ